MVSGDLGVGGNARWLTWDGMTHSHRPDNGAAQGTLQNAGDKPCQVLETTSVWRSVRVRRWATVQVARDGAGAGVQ